MNIMRKSLRQIVLVAAALAIGATTAAAGQCPGHPNALGTSRTIVLDPREHGRIGTMNYAETLPLVDKEVVLTFDDGPLPPYTNKILDILASECVHATYFIVGRMAKAYPALVRRAYQEGHTIGTHSMNHPYPFRAQGLERSQAEIDGGIAATAAALGNPKEVAPFFRFPGLGRTDPVEGYLASRGLMAWSADFPADDWMRIGASEIVKRALRRLEAKGKGILLLHDIHPATVLALPVILKELKARGYRIVHVVPASASRPKTPTTAEAWLMHPRRKPQLPVISVAAVQDLDGGSMLKKTAAALCGLKPTREPPIRTASRRRYRHGRYQKRVHLARPGATSRTGVSRHAGRANSAIAARPD
jgi:peptidoglycan/xylan/chitin deacetylase (PgdA/CDA1 family)